MFLKIYKGVTATSWEEKQGFKKAFVAPWSEKLRFLGLFSVCLRLLFMCGLAQGFFKFTHY